jgi:hypothetical protein
MMIYQEKIAPPAALPVIPPTAEQMRLIKEALADEDRCVKHLIDGLAGLIRDVKH